MAGCEASKRENDDVTYRVDVEEITLRLLFWHLVWIVGH